MKVKVLAAMTVAVPVLAFAEVRETPTTNGEEIIVTAARLSQTVDDSLAAVTVIDRAEIERTQANSVLDMLRRVPGVTVINSGGAGKLSNVFLRGTESDHVIVLIDGVRHASVSAGTTAFDNLPLEMVERIEVVRGPRSSLYGSDAIGGVIQIFTRRGGGTATPRFSMRAGSFDTIESQFGLNVGNEQSWIDVGFGFSKTTGINACNGDSVNFVGCFVEQPDRDGYREVSGSLRFGHQFEMGLEVDARVLSAQSTVEFDGSAFAGNESDILQQVSGLTLRYSPLSFWDFSIDFGRSLDQFTSEFEGTFVTSIESSKNSISFQNNFEVTDNQILTIGADYLRDQVDANPAFQLLTRINRGAFGQYLIDWGVVDLQIAGRYDDDERFGGHSTGSAAFGVDVTDWLRFTASHGTAFRAPNFNELANPFGSGNLNLDPERSRSSELGFALDVVGVSIELNAFHTEIEDLIQAFPIVNIQEARISGVELGASSRVFGFDIVGHVTVIDAENRSTGANQGNRLVRRPEETFQLDIDRSVGPVDLGLSVFASGSSFDDAANNRELDGYALLDLRGEMEVVDGWKLQLSVNNVLDKQYETVSLFNQPGRSAYLTLRYQP